MKPTCLLVAHLVSLGAWFMNKFGLLEMWSTQGMDKSHYREREFTSKKLITKLEGIIQVNLRRCLIGSFVSHLGGILQGRGRKGQFWPS